MPLIGGSLDLAHIGQILPLPSRIPHYRAHGMCRYDCPGKRCLWLHIVILLKPTVQTVQTVFMQV